MGREGEGERRAEKRRGKEEREEKRRRGKGRKLRVRIGDRRGRLEEREGKKERRKVRSGTRTRDFLTGERMTQGTRSLIKRYAQGLIKSGFPFNMRIKNELLVPGENKYWN